MSRTTLILAAILGALLIFPGGAAAQSCDVDRSGYFNCSRGGLSASGYVDRWGDYTGTIRGSDSYGNTYRGTFSGDADFLRGRTTVTTPWYEPGGSVSREYTTTCYVFCTTR